MGTENIVLQRRKNRDGKGRKYLEKKIFFGGEGKGGKYLEKKKRRKYGEGKGRKSIREGKCYGGRTGRHCEDSARILNSKVAMIKLVFKKFVCLKKSHHKNAKLHSTHRIKKLWYNYVSKCMIM